MRLAIQRRFGTGEGRRLFVVFAAVVGITASVVAFVSVSGWHNQLRYVKLEQLARYRNQTIAANLASTDELLQTIAEYIQSLDHPVGRSEFFAISRPMRSRRPELRAMGWTVEVPASERGAFEQAMRENGEPGFEIWDFDANGKRHRAGDRDRYFPIVYRDADDNAAVVGLDLLAMPEREEAMRHALASGQPFATAPIRLILEKGIALMSFSAAVAPRGGSKAPLSAGYVFTVFSLQNVFQKIIAKTLPLGFDLYVYDPQQDSKNRFIYWHPSWTRPAPVPFTSEASLLARPHFSTSFNIAGREFGALYVPTERFLNQDASWGAPATLLAGLAITATLVIYLVTSLRRTAQLENLAAKLQTLNQRFNAALDNMPHGLSMFDSEQRLIVCNKSYADMYRLDAEHAKPGTTLRAILEARAASSAGINMGSEFDIAQRVEQTSQGEKFCIDDDLLDGRTISIAHQPMAGGGWVSVHQDITERRRIEKSLEAASRAKSSFLATMSHEIRTPMTAVLGLASSLLDTDLDESQRKSVMTVYEAGESLLGILNDILDFSKLESGRIGFELIAFSPRRLLDGVLGIFEPRAAAKGVAVRSACDVTLPAALKGDLGRIRQVLLNLVSNAIKFTERGEIEIAVRCLSRGEAEATIEWRVRDTGIGVAGDCIEDLFKEFTQADASISRRFGGSGLGLAICKRLVEQMGGQIGAVSTQGEGSTFSFSLTLPIADAAVEEIEDSASYAAFAARLNDLGRPLRILIADDRPTNRLVVAKMLEPFAIQVDEVCDGAHAVTAASQTHYDAILMDVRMPEMDGLEATRAIRRLSGPRSTVPIIAFTANAFAEDVKNCFEAGMNDFLPKPIQKQNLVGAIARSIQANSQSSKATEPAIVEAQAKQEPSPDAAPLVDRGIFDELTAAIGGAAAAEVLNMFVRDAETRLRALRQLSCNGDREAIKTEAHSLKSEAATLGLLQLSRLARSLEHSALVIDREQYVAMMDRLDATFELTRAELPISLAA